MTTNPCNLTRLLATHDASQNADGSPVHSVLTRLGSVWARPLFGSMATRLQMQHQVAGAGQRHALLINGGRMPGVRVVAAPQRKVRCRASNMDLVDEVTGEVLSRTSVLNKAAGYSLDVDGVEWAYRKSEPVAAKASPDKLQVLLLHGLGSSSWSYRRTLAMLGEAGYEAYAPDWPGHGESSKPPAGSFAYSQQAYLEGLAGFVAAAGIKQPFALVVQGYVLGQYGLVYALQHEDQVERLFILNTPLATNSKLRPELAAYKSPIPFLRPGNKPFDGAMYNMMGSPYAMMEADVMVYAQPYKEDPAASAAVAATMDQLDFNALLQQVDSGYRSWRKPSLLLFGANDPFVDIQNPFKFLDDKRTNMRLVTAGAKLGHCPQEDYPEAIQDTLEAFLSGEADSWPIGKVVASRMTKKGLVDG